MRQALEGNQFPALKSADPKAAAAGLERLVEQLGVTKEADFAPVAAIIQNPCVAFIFRILPIVQAGYSYKKMTALSSPPRRPRTNTESGGTDAS